LVIASIALVLAVGGGSAALALTDKQSDKRIAKRVANKQITKRAPGLSVNHANSANTANSAKTAGSATAKNVYFARVEGTGATPTLIAGSAGVTVNATRPSSGTGFATVNFPVSMDNCGITVTPFTGSGNNQGARQSAGPGGLSSGPAVSVLTYVGATNTNLSFNIVGVC